MSRILNRKWYIIFEITNNILRYSSVDVPENKVSDLKTFFALKKVIKEVMTLVFKRYLCVSYRCREKRPKAGFQPGRFVSY